MRPRLQQGQVLKHGSNWVLRFREEREVNGAIKRVRATEILAPYSDFPEKPTEEILEQVRKRYQEKIAKLLAPGNKNTAPVMGVATVAEFIEHNYFPRLEWRLTVPAGNELHIEPSTIEGYRDILKIHVKDNPIAKIKLRNFTTRDGQRFLESLNQALSHQTHMRIKNFLRGVFTWAIADGAFTEMNPMENTKAGGSTKKRTTGLTERERKIQASNEHAYTLEEVAEMMDKLPEPARTVCAVAAFTGLTRSELRGLKWQDYDGESISVQRKIWNTHVGPPKTEAREAGIYVIPLLRKILTKYKAAFPSLGEGWIFRGEKLLRPLDLDNLSRRDIPQYINGAWFGWHAFRRGLGTRLNEARVDDKDIQSILRHADVSTTQAYYILPNHDRAQAGMKKLGKTLQTKYGIKA
jgi:integrase